MFRTAGHIRALVIAAVVGLLPLSSMLYQPLAHAQGAPDTQLAPAAPTDNAPTEDPVPGSAWAASTASPALWPPRAELPRAARDAFRHPGHLRRIDRPPRV